MSEVSHDPDRDLGRVRLRKLDACLTDLEDAHERGEVIVSADLASRLAGVVHGVRPGIPITDALALVFQNQEPLLIRGSSVAPRRAGSDRLAALAPAPPLVPGWDQPLDAAGARDLTERIKCEARQVWRLLLEAHDRRAWCALGYRSWEEYVWIEFGLSRSRSYELVDQGRVIRALQAAAGMSGPPNISTYAATQIKPLLPDVIAAVRHRTAECADSETAVIVAEVVREMRAQIPVKRGRSSEGAPVPETEALSEDARGIHGDVLRRFFRAIDSLTQMTAAAEAAAAIPPDEAYRLDQLESALQWLAEFTRSWRRRVPQDEVALAATSASC